MNYTLRRSTYLTKFSETFLITELISIHLYVKLFLYNRILTIWSMFRTVHKCPVIWYYKLQQTRWPVFKKHKGDLFSLGDEDGSTFYRVYYLDVA